jgi:hypothetical protein
VESGEVYEASQRLKAAHLCVVAVENLKGCKVLQRLQAAHFCAAAHELLKVYEALQQL